MRLIVIEILGIDKDLIVRNIIASVLLSCLLAVGVTHGAILAEYDADAGTPVENPTVQGWTESGLGANVTVEGINDNGTNAWRILDNAVDNNPRYSASLSASDFEMMYNRGWKFTMVVRTISGDPMAGFCGWGVTAKTDPGWGLVIIERVGFSMQIVADNAFQVTPIHGGTITLGTDSANNFHSISCVGAAFSSQYEFFLDGASQGVFDIKDGSSNDNYRNTIKFASGSTSASGREAYWNYVGLAALGVNVVESDGDTTVAEEGSTTDTYTVSLSDQPTDTVTVTIDPNSADIDLGAGAGVPVILEWQPTNWTDVKTVTVRAVDDTLSEGPHQATITHAVSSTDPIYNNIVVAPVVVDINDNEAFCGDENTTYLPADINRDCYVNLVDFALIAHDWLACTDPSSEECYPYIPAEPLFETDVFVSGTEGYHTYRIPAMLTTHAGTVLAFAEGREGLGDADQNDIVLKRSTDGGNTWGPLILVDERGDDNLNNPQAVQVQETGRIILHYVRFPQGCHVNCVVPGYTGNVTRVYQTYSDDDGLTWSVPTDISTMVKDADMTNSIPGIGVGFQLRRGPDAGRIIMPYMSRWTYQSKNVRAMMSDDFGATWFGGDYPSYENTNSTCGEVQMVELVDGSLLLNGRSTANKRRMVATSTDSGMTWGTHSQALALIEPPCMATTLRLSDPLDGRQSRIIFANPGATSSRTYGTVRVSYDEGATWPVLKVIQQGFFAYSCLTVLPDGKIGLLYESDSYGKIKFARFSLKWLTDGQDWMEQ